LKLPNVKKQTKKEILSGITFYEGDDFLPHVIGYRAQVRQL